MRLIRRNYIWRELDADVCCCQTRSAKVEIGADAVLAAHHVLLHANPHWWAPPPTPLCQYLLRPGCGQVAGPSSAEGTRLGGAHTLGPDTGWRHL